MHTTVEVVRRTWYVSDVQPHVRTDEPGLGEIVAWADTNPPRWRLVTENKSHEFGREGNHYVAASRGPSPMATLYRLLSLKATLDGFPGRPPTFLAWRADFALAMQEHRQFRSGRLVAWDGKYERNACSVDYTPGRLEEVIDRYLVWCGDQYDIAEVRLNGTPVRAGCPHAGGKTPGTDGALRCDGCGKALGKLW